MDEPPAPPADESAGAESALPPTAAEKVDATAATTMADPWPSRLRGGWPAIDFAEATPDLKAQPSGAAVRLVDGKGQLAAFGLIDRENKVVRILPALPKDVLDAEFFLRRVERAFDLRRRLRLTGPRAAYRLINSEGDGLSGFVVDVLANHAIVYTYSPSFDRYADWLGEAVAKRVGASSVVHKVRPRGEPPAGRMPYRLLFGDAPPKQLTVEERGVQYEVHPVGGLNTGLFCDMRDVRSAVGRLSRGLRVLNTFAYTGSFSVVAALNKARAVTTVDFATGVLLWAKANFELNGLDPASPEYRFAKADVFDFLKHERRKEHGFNFILLDPPTTTNVPGRRWFLKSDYDRLIGHALAVLDRFGFLLVAANSLDTRPEGVEQQIKAAARDHDRRLRLIESFGLPPDYPTQIIHPASRHLKCFLLQADV